MLVIFWKEEFQKRLLFRINCGKDISDEKGNIQKKEMDLAIAYLIEGQSTPALFQGGIIKMAVKY